jgi:hypothetical protein
MYFTRVVGKLALCAALIMPASSWAAHPLITDDAGTQGKGKFQLEVNGQYDSDQETVAGVSTKETGGQVSTTLSYGIDENTDVVLTVPHQWDKLQENGMTTSNVNGLSDTTLEVKMRFYEKDGLSLALKPGVIMPTGDENKGLGAGKAGYSAFFITTKEAAPWAFHMNLGYIRNENKADEEKNIWHASLAATYEVIKNLKVVGNLGIERNPDKVSDNDPAFLLGGVIYSVVENFDIDFGVKTGLTSSETDLALMAGTTFRF